MGKFQILVFIFIGIFFGLLLSPLYENYLSKDTREYCDHDGVYFYDMSEMFRAIKKDGYKIDGFDYAYVCNVNKLFIPAVSEYPNVVFYGVTRGNITMLPGEISQIKGLSRFQIHDQEIKTLPAEIGTLTELKILKLGGNDLESVPAEIGRLENLEVLHLYDNRILTLPPETGNLNSLKILDLRMNSLSSLPNELGNLSGTLEFLFLGGNNFDESEKIKIRDLLPQTTIFF
jgi:Leucine-rich repeat (LRR) protein